MALVAVVAVVALLTAAVNLVQSGRASADGSLQFTNWVTLGGASKGAAASTTWGPGRLDVFVRGTDNQLWHKWYAGAWSAWESLGSPPGGLGSDPGAVAWSAGRIDVFAAGADGHLWHRWYGGRWSGWENLGGGVVGAPAVSSWGAGRLDVFVRGTDNQLWHRWFSGSWSGWDGRGGLLTSAPAAVSWGPGRIDVFVRGSNLAAWHVAFAGAWTGFASLGGVLASSPGVSSWGIGRLDLFARGTDNRLYHQWMSNSGWSGWQLALGGALTSGPAAVSWATGRTDVFARGADSGIWHTVGSLPVAGIVALPDMQLQVPTSDISIGSDAAGVRQLQFTHITWDAGTGPFEIDPTYDPTSGTATFQQAIYQSSIPGQWTPAYHVPLAVRGVFDPPSDYHFPLTSFTLNAVNADGSPGPVVATSPKTDYCITADAFVGGVPNTPAQTFIPQSNCNDPTLPLGWSVGWGDEYDQTDSGQPISLNGVPDGTYILRGIVDPLHVLAESNRTNNEVDTTLSISGDTVTILSQRRPISTPPTVTVTSPTNGAAVSGTVIVSASATATAPATVVSVQFLLDGLPLGSPVMSAPFTFSWTVGTTSLGAHSLSARVTDSNGGTATAPAVSVSVLPSGGVQIDRTITQTGSGAIKTSSFSTSAAGETLVAFVDSDGPNAGSAQSTTISGAGLTWSLVKRSNAQPGDAEIWTAQASSILINATVTSAPASAGYDQMLTVVAFAGAGGLGASAVAAAPSGAPTIRLVSTESGSLMYATGTDWDTATPRSIASGQSMLSQWVDSGSGSTFWTQGITTPTPASGQTVALSDTAPTADRWDLAGVEVRPQTAVASMPPSMSLMNPTSGQILSATVPVAAAVADDAGIASVQFLLDGRPLGRPLSSAPYALRWDTTTATPGAHILSVRATDTSGLVGTSAGVAVNVANPAPPMTCFVLQARVAAYGRGTITTPPFHTAAAREVLMALVSADGPPGAGRQRAAVSGAGLKWTLVKRQNSQAGDSEVWVATADKVLSDARVHSTEAQPGFAQDLTVIALEGVSGIGAAAGSSGVSRAPDVALTTTRRTSVVFAVGNDPGHAEARTWPPGWVPLSQVLDTASGRSHWSQYTNDPTGPAGSFVAVRDTAPTKDGWNLVAVELVNEES